MIDANTIRSFGEKTAQQEVDALLGFLVGWVKKNKDRTRFFKCGNFWGKEASAQTEKYLEVERILRSLGFNVEFCEDAEDCEYHIPCEMRNNGPFTIISW